LGELVPLPIGDKGEKFIILLRKIKKTTNSGAKIGGLLILGISHLPNANYGFYF
jgi:hypothetical protein